LIARAIYQNSDRANAPFVAINCAAIPETLLESELFGHERGAFTGATGQRIGRFEQAGHGTIFLDEIGDMTPGTQVKLLRVIQEKCVQRLGGRETIQVDARVLAATHHDLEAAIREKRFREDLYYRLNVVEITLPALRQRREDIPALVRYFLSKYGPELGNPSPSIHADAMEFLQSHSWPGNVRELENAVRKALLLAQGYTVNVDHARAALRREAGQSGPVGQSLGEYIGDLLAAAQRGEGAEVHARVLETAERELFRQAIGLAQGNQAKAARWLGVSRITMKAKLVQFGFHPGTDNEAGA
jgi:DNA-binding NtrC family response regulator